MLDPWRCQWTWQKHFGCMCLVAQENTMQVLALQLLVKGWCVDDPRVACRTRQMCSNQLNLLLVIHDHSDVQAGIIFQHTKSSSMSAGHSSSECRHLCRLLAGRTYEERSVKLSAFSRPPVLSLCIAPTNAMRSLDFVFDDIRLNEHSYYEWGYRRVGG